MRKKILILILFCLIIFLGYFIINIIKEDEKSSLKKVVVAEVTHSIFYAPQYVADSLGYFKELYLFFQ